LNFAPRYCIRPRAASISIFPDLAAQPSSETAVTMIG
jgi:hypothetical protein